MRVPLTPSSAVIDQMARFGPRAQNQLFEEVGRQEEVGRSGGKMKEEEEKSWKEKFRNWMIYQGVWLTRSYMSLEIVLSSSR